jgi:purine-nucleoside phosphorylase
MLYILSKGDVFTFGVEKAYADTEKLIKSQPYIHDYKIHNGEAFDIDLTKWRSSDILMTGSFGHIYNKEYGVECIIRIGTAGSYHPHIKLYDVINVDVACSESTFAKYAFDIDGNLITHQGNAFDIINETAEEKGVPLLTGAIHSSDIFYRKNMDNPAIVAEYNCLAVEMEAFALFANAKFLGKTASTLLTISDVIPTHEQISADAREKSLNPMIELALESAIRFQKSL